VHNTHIKRTIVPIPLAQLGRSAATTVATAAIRVFPRAQRAYG